MEKTESGRQAKVPWALRVRHRQVCEREKDLLKRAAQTCFSLYRGRFIIRHTPGLEQKVLWVTRQHPEKRAIIWTRKRHARAIPEAIRRPERIILWVTGHFNVQVKESNFLRPSSTAQTSSSRATPSAVERPDPERVGWKGCSSIAPRQDCNLVVSVFVTRWA